MNKENKAAFEGLIPKLSKAIEELFNLHSEGPCLSTSSSSQQNTNLSTRSSFHVPVPNRVLLALPLQQFLNVP